MLHLNSELLPIYKMLVHNIYRFACFYHPPIIYLDAKMLENERDGSGLWFF